MAHVSDQSVALSTRTTMRVGGLAERFVVAENTDEVIDAIRDGDAASEGLMILSGGSNLVVADAGVPGTTVHIASRGIRTATPDLGGRVLIDVAAGEPWDEFVAYTVAQGWAGIEALSGIPGCVGSTPVQNVGAYGQEVSQTITRVRTWDRARGQVRTFTGAECKFSYRHSRFKTTAMPGAPQWLGASSPRYVVLEVQFQLDVTEQSRPIAYADLARGLGVELGAQVPLADAREAVLAQRHRRGMVLNAGDKDTWSCGSFFTNPILDQTQFSDLRARVKQRLGPEVEPPRYPVDAAPGKVKTSAAWLIDRAGFGKGYGMPGPAALSTKHALAVTNRGGAQAKDVVALARAVRGGVDEVFGVTLANEPVLVGLTL